MSMHAVTYEGPRELVYGERPDPPLAPGDVRIAVESAGVCGTDVRIFKGEHAAYAGGRGRVPGHEIAGRIAEAPPGALPAGLAVGGLVFVAPNIGCGHCPQCRGGNENLCPATEGIGITLDGGFADRVVVPARAVRKGNLIPLDAAADPDAAVLIEPLACVLRGQEKAGVRAGDTVLVAGCGPVGLLHVALARARGAETVLASDPSPQRRLAAARAGAAVVVDPAAEDLAAAVAEATGGAGAGVVITAAPVHALQSEAVRLAGVGGRVLLFGGLPRGRPTVELDTNAIHYKELVVTGTTASTLQDCRRAAELVGQGRIDLAWMVSDTLPLADAARAVDKVQDAAALKVVLKPSANGRVAP
ncbi:zinc-binding dehydrogenase [Dactylosporangium sp. CA-092794]|uniref:zinc-binding dehydrogenase n=1 Tax=Dactylosporangium sp. CA-092794 TaxID=3239929 RepID=UPI003D93E380